MRKNLQRVILTAAVVMTGVQGNTQSSIEAPVTTENTVMRTSGDCSPIIASGGTLAGGINCDFSVQPNLLAELLGSLEMQAFLDKNPKIEKALEDGNFERAAELAIAASGGRAKYILAIGCYYLEMRFDKAAEYIELAHALYPGELAFSDAQGATAEAAQLAFETGDFDVEAGKDPPLSPEYSAAEIRAADAFFEELPITNIRGAVRSSLSVSTSLPTDQEVEKYQGRCEKLTADLGTISFVGRPLYPAQSEYQPQGEVHTGIAGPSDCLLRMRKELAELKLSEYFHAISTRARDLAERIRRGGDSSSRAARFHLFMYCATFGSQSPEGQCSAHAYRELQQIADLYGPSTALMMSGQWMLYFQFAPRRGHLELFLRQTLPLRARILGGDARVGTVAPREMNLFTVRYFDLLRIIAVRTMVDTGSIINLGTVQAPRLPTAAELESRERLRAYLSDTLEDAFLVDRKAKSKLGRLFEAMLYVAILDAANTNEDPALARASQRELTQSWRYFSRDRVLAKSFGTLFCEREIVLTERACSRYAEEN